MVWDQLAAAADVSLVRGEAGYTHPMQRYTKHLHAPSAQQTAQLDMLQGGAAAATSADKEVLLRATLAMKAGDYAAATK